MQRLAGAPEPWSRCAHPAGGGGEDARDAPSLPAHIFTPEMGESSHCPSQGGMLKHEAKNVFVAVCTYR